MSDRKLIEQTSDAELHARIGDYNEEIRRLREMRRPLIAERQRRELRRSAEQKLAKLTPEEASALQSDSGELQGGVDCVVEFGTSIRIGSHESSTVNADQQIAMTFDSKSFDDRTSIASRRRSLKKWSTPKAISPFTMSLR